MLPQASEISVPICIQGCW